MGKINLLDFQVANLIAAGEVVDRPASALKELLENSIDAGAKHITVELKRGGVSFIRVSDDGVGMTEEDVPVCVKRHATSKIKYASDLDGICTLGFRGEALAAIASVSKLRIMTRTRDDDMGTIMECVSGEPVSVTRGGAQVGTTVIIEELFANVPARRKFLKRDVSEGMACNAVVEKVALSHPEISFKLITDGTMKYVTQGNGNLIETIYAVLGRDFAGKLLQVDSLMEGISVYGYIGSPENVRANRNFQNFFINQRYVKSKTAMSALEQAYDSFIPKEKFPCCVLNVKIHPAFVDVNVHPTKLEVKFSDEKKVFDAVYCAVRNVLEQKLTRPQMKIEPSSVSYDDIKLKNAFAPIYDRAETILSNKPEQRVMFDIPDMPVSVQEKRAEPVRESFIPQRTQPLVRDDIPPKEEIKADVTEAPVRVLEERTPLSRETGRKEIPYYKIIGEAFNSYVMVELEDKMLMIDKHAAHERIIFETMKENMQKGDTAMQMLMLPIEVPLAEVEAATYADYSEEILAMGFEAQLKGKTLYVTGIPTQLEENAAREMLEVLIDRLSYGTGTAELTRKLFMEKALYQASCKAAIKAGRIEEREHVRWICDNLLALDDIKYCPHGRPVAIEMSRNEMERQFKRT